LDRERRGSRLAAKQQEATMSEDFPHRCFTVPEAAEHLRISRAMIYKLFKAEHLKPMKIGKRTIVSGEEIDRFLHKGAVI
jgi:excisionase family DNA binding protein